MIEAELKARLIDPDAVRAALGERADVERAIYHDTYFDTTDGALERSGRELRLRTVEMPGLVRHVLTFKEPTVDEESGSKPEYESTVATPDAVAYMVQALGYGPVLEFTKDCENHRFVDGGREFLATVVSVSEIEGTFLEVETMADDDHIGPALEAVRGVLDQLGVCSVRTDDRAVYRRCPRGTSELKRTSAKVSMSAIRAWTSHGRRGPITYRGGAMTIEPCDGIGCHGYARHARSNMPVRLLRPYKRQNINGQWAESWQRHGTTSFDGPLRHRFDRTARPGTIRLAALRSRL